MLSIIILKLYVTLLLFEVVELVEVFWFEFVWFVVLFVVLFVLLFVVLFVVLLLFVVFAVVLFVPLVGKVVFIVDSHMFYVTFKL